MRYIELAIPHEFDGIRTQISQELNIPKTAVKKIIKDLRTRQNIPSWWEIQTYQGSEEELAKIRTAYEPLLPVPPIGIHRKIAEELGLKPTTVYQAIKTIRTEMKLPQYNDPALHDMELPAQTQAVGEHVEAEQSAVAPTEAAIVASGSSSDTIVPREETVTTAADGGTKE
jgi:hypothetical protein